MAIKSYIFMVAGIVFAKSVGFLRDIFFASRFGTNTETDVYFTVFSVVTLIFTGIGVALSTLIIKQLNKKSYSDPETERQYVSFFIKRILIFLLIVCAFMYAFSRSLTALLVPVTDAKTFDLAHKIFCIMIPSVAFVTLAYILYGVLQNKRVFFITSIMSVPYNLLVIISLFVPEISILTISVITTLGWLSHILILMPDFYRKGYRFFTKGQSFKMPAGEIVWIFISNMMLQLCLMLDKSMVVSSSGMATCVNYSSNLFITLSSVFIVAMSSVTFPSLTKSFEAGDTGTVKSIFSEILSLMLAIFLPFLLVSTLFGKNLVSLLYERGEFDAVSAYNAAVLFIIYSFSILGYLAEQIFNKILFLSGKYKFTVLATLIVVALKFVLNLCLIPKFGTFSAAFTTAILLSGYGIFSLIKIRFVIGSFFEKPLLQSFLKTAISAFLAFLVYVIFALFIPEIVKNKTLFLIPVLICGVVYLLSLYFSGEGKKLISTIKK